MYDPHPLGKINLTSLVCSMDLSRHQRDSYIGRVPVKKKTVVKKGQKSRLGTWVRFDYALELADKWDWPLYVKTAIVMAKEDSHGAS